MDLLLLADPSEAKVRTYLPESKCFVASSAGAVVGACVVKPLSAGAHELMCIAVQPACQKSGHGSALLKWVIDFYRKSGATQLEVGTGTFGYQLAFYQKLGFRVSGIDHDFFVKNYPEPIFENGIQLFDMLRLVLGFPRNADGSPFRAACGAADPAAGQSRLMRQPIAAGVVHGVPEDLAAALFADDHALAIWEGISPLARNEWICWVENAKKHPTRLKRIARVPADLKSGKRRPCCWPGCPHGKSGRPRFRCPSAPRP